MNKLNETIHALYSAIQTMIEKNARDLVKISPIDLKFLQNPDNTLKQKLLYISAHLPKDGEIARIIKNKILDVEKQLSEQALKLGEDISQTLINAIELLNKSITESLEAQKSSLLNNITTFFSGLPKKT